MIVENAKEAIAIEAKAIERLLDRIDSNFEKYGLETIVTGANDDENQKAF
jgi:hypothetical protein